MLFGMILLAAPLTAQEKIAITGSGDREYNIFDQYPSSLGVTLGSMETFGLSWKRWFGKTAFEITAGGMWDPSTTMGSIYWYAVTGALSYRLYAEDFANWFSGGLYLVAYGGHGGEDSIDYVYDPEKDTSDTVRSGYSPYIYAGGGIGIETVLFKHFSQELQFLYIGRFLSSPGIQFGVNASFRYRY
jgi:hypothetical protein